MKQNLLRPTAFLGTVAAMLAITVVLTLSHATHFGGSIGSLKCYDAAGGKEKAC
jgi:alkyl sulfatase BDS1-like metallo-beta-lactamase superfamily hydrolase